MVVLFFLFFLSFFLSSFLSTMSTSFWPNQIDTANKILESFTNGNRQILLNAQMQSGKTGIFLFACFEMLYRGLINRVVIICGSNENELHEQLIRDRNEKAKEFVNKYMLGMTAFTRSTTISHFQKTAVEVYKSSDLHSVKPITDSTLVIWDESHYAQRIQNLPFKFLQNSGLSVENNAVADEKWSSKNSFFMSVSATPFAQFSDYAHENNLDINTLVVIQHIPSELYRGVEYYWNAGVIHKSFSISKTPHLFTELVASFRNEKKWALVRSRNLDLVKGCCIGAGVRYKEYTATKKDLASLDDLNYAPNEFTVIGIKGMCRMGKVVPKKYIGFVFDEAAKSKTDCLLQSFLGRMCGYGPFSTVLPHIYVPEAFLVVDAKLGSEIDRYIRFSNGIHIIPTKGACLTKGLPISGKYILEARRVEYDVEVNDLTRREIIQNLAEEYINNYPYLDSVQQAEAVERITHLNQIEIHDISCDTYKYVRDGLPDLIAGKRWDDNWNRGKYFKIYHDMDGFYITGYTDEANDQTKLVCKKAIVPTDGKEVWNPNRRNDTLNIIQTTADFNSLNINLTNAGQHTVFIHKSLRSDPRMKLLMDVSSKGRGGKQWPKNVVANRSDFHRLVIVITIEIKITIAIHTN